MVYDEAFVTGAETDDGGKRALLLAKSLRSTFTRKNLIVFTGNDLSAHIRESLSLEFDLVLSSTNLEICEDTEDLDFDEKLKILLHGCQLFERAIFISSFVLVLHNIDDIFDICFPRDNSDNTFKFTENINATPIDLFAPLFAICPSLSAMNRMKAQFFLKRPSNLIELQHLQGKLSRYCKSHGALTEPSSESRNNDVINSDNSGKAKFVIYNGISDNNISAKYEAEIQKSQYLCPAVRLCKLKQEAIAIIGMACRLPDANDVEEFWDLMMKNGDGIKQVPSWRWLDEQTPNVTARARDTLAGFLKCPVDEFDAKFFGISPKEMEYVDPQQRFLLEVSWEALEDASIDPLSLKGTQTGIFTGTWTRDYAELMIKAGFSDQDFFRSYLGNSFGATAGRMAHFYGTTGENISTDSGCSSSIVAVGLACKSLRRKDTRLAIACGVNLLLHPIGYENMSAFLAKDGHCKTFDAEADGFGRAEGCGVLVLKRLSDAIRDKDKIRAVIRGYGEAQEGPSKSLGTPTVEVESLAMKLALENAQILPTEVSFVETHGSGTTVGDDIEVQAIANVYGGILRETPLVLTSVKTNVGHTESASGITGIIKAVLALERDTIPPHRSLNKLNPKLDLDQIPAVIPLTPYEWNKTDGKRRIAGVSSFGITGTDAHVILEEKPNRPPKNVEPSNSSTISIMTLSARSRESLEDLMKRYADLLKNSSLSWEDVAHTANTGRAHFKEYRTAVLAKSSSDFLKQVELGNFNQPEKFDPNKKPKIAYVFTGQGSQFFGMAQDYFSFSQPFRKYFNRCDKILQDKFSIDLKHVMWETSDEKLINQALYSQTAIFVVSYSLSKMWISHGISPDIVLGHSLGEYAAACIAGMINLTDALKLVAERSKIISSFPEGKMIVVNLDESNSRRLVEKANVSLDIAAVNTAEQTTLAGQEAEVLNLKEYCTKHGLKSHILESSHAYHSNMMDPILPLLRKSTSSVVYTQSKCTFISALKGQKIEHVDAEYWVEHTRNPVKFLRASKEIQNEEPTICIEVGPQPTLISFLSQNLPTTGKPLMVPSIRRKEENRKTFLRGIAELYNAGCDIQWEGINSGNKIRGLPTYPFQRKKFWFPKTNLDNGISFTGKVLHPLVHFQHDSAALSTIFDTRLSLEKLPYLSDHVVGTNIIFPAAGFLEMSLAAGHLSSFSDFDNFMYPRQPIQLLNLIVEAPLLLSHETETNMQIIVSEPDNSNLSKVEVFRRQVDSEGSKSWFRHAVAKFSSVVPVELWHSEVFEVEQFKQNSSCEPISEFYSKLDSIGLKFGNSFQSIQRLFKSSDTILAEISVPVQHGVFVHPIAVDAMIQTLLLGQCYESIQIMLPVKVEKFVWHPNATDSSESLYVLASIHADEKSSKLLNSAGHTIATMTGVTMVPTTVASIEASLESQNVVLPNMYEEVWISTNSCTTIKPSVFSSKTLPSINEQIFSQLLIHLEELTELEKQEQILTNKLAALYGLKGLVELGWNPGVGDVIDVRSFASTYGIPNKNLLLLRRIFEIISRHTNYLKGEDWIFQLQTSLPSFSERKETIFRLQDSMKFSIDVEILQTVAPKLSSVLKGEDSVVPLLFREDKLASKFYVESKLLQRLNIMPTVLITQLAREFDLCNKVKILEIGAGTGGTTRSILAALEDNHVKYEYTFTDLSPGFFGAAQTLLESWKDHIIYQQLNIEKDPKSQKFMPEDYDLIFAFNVLHATADIKQTISNTRHLLRPGGLIVIGEVFEPSPLLDLTFGLTEGYWRFNDLNLRPFHCLLNETQWSNIFSSHGFSFIRAMKIPGATEGIVIAQATAQSVPYYFSSENLETSWIVIQIGVSSPTTLQIISEFSRLGRKAILLGDFSFDELKRNISQPTLEGILFISQDQNLASQFQQEAEVFLNLMKAYLICSTNTTLVVVTTGTAVIGDQGVAAPHGGIIWGMSKTLRSEMNNGKIFNIDLDPNEKPDVNATSLLRLLWTLKDDFVAVRNNEIFTSKLKPWKASNVSLSLPKASKTQVLILPSSNLVADLKFGPGTLTVPQENQIEITVKAYGLNFRDVLCVLKPSKQFYQNPTVGADMAGIVTAVGKNVSRLSIGDRVIGCFYAFGGLPSHLVVDADLVAKLPPKLTYADGSTIPAVFATAYYCLIKVAGVKKGQTILIHTASGGVGLAAIQIAKARDVRIIATAGSRRKRSYLKQVLNIQDVFNSRDLSFKEKVLEVTHNSGVDIVLNTLTGAGFKEASLDVCSDGGLFIEISKLNIWNQQQFNDQGRPLVHYHLADLTSLRTEEWKHIVSVIEINLENETYLPLPYVRFFTTDIRAALDCLQNARHVGKIVCVAPEKLPMSPNLQWLLFNNQSTYLITGGLGGIGLEAAKWMASEGAQFLILCGRKPGSDSAIETISQLNRQGKKILSLQVDVGSYTECHDLVHKINSGELLLDGIKFPPLRGIQHAAGCLRDDMISNQTWEKYKEVFQGKVYGAWNLHTLTKDLALPLDHFVLYSSLASGFGNVGQSNHAAANGFLDGLASFRNTIGLAATSVNWGQWGKIGVAAKLEFDFLSPFTPTQAFASLKEILRHQKPQIGVANKISPKLAAIFPWTFRGYANAIVEIDASNASRKRSNMTTETFWETYNACKDDQQASEVYLQKMLKDTIRNMLKLEEQEHIDINQSFQDIGLDSLMVVELRNTLQTILGPDIKMNVETFSDANTITKLALKLRGMLSGDEPSKLTREQLIDLIRSDSQISPNIIPCDGEYCKPSEIKHIFITGVTGNLGPYILRDVASLSNVDKIYCLTRAKTKQEGKQRIIELLKEKDLFNVEIEEKTECVVGSVEKPKLGMTSEDYEHLALNTEGVIHLAVKSNFTETYSQQSEIRAVNVSGTANVLEFVCCGKTKILFHASSIVASEALNEDNTLSEAWPGADEFNESPNLAYMISKYVSDRLVTQAHEKGVPVKLFRFPAVAGDSKTGANINFENSGMMLHLLSYFFLKKIPALSVPMFVLPVDICSLLSIRLFFDDNCPFDVYNVYNPYSCCETEIVQIAQEMGYTIDVEEVGKFQERITNETSDSLVIRSVLVWNEGKENTNFLNGAIIKAWTNNPKNAFLSKKLCKYIPEWYPSKMESPLDIVRRDLKHAMEIGLFQKFGIV